MRQLSSNYSVTYTLLGKNKKIKSIGSKVACYSSLYKAKIEETDVLILEDFLAKETHQYSRIYLKRIAKICQLKIKFLEENKIKVTGFKSLFLLKLFTTLFRILFEVYSTYGYKEPSYPVRTVNFFNSYIKKKNRTGHKDMLKRLIYHYQANECYNGPGHGISTSENQKIRLRGTDELINWKDDSNNMQDFFQ
jgi:hypothetical protein